MKQLGLCCQNRYDTDNEIPPFARIIGTDWYDGLLEGFVECGCCKKAYWFSTIAWYVHQRERIYAFMPIGDGQFGRVKGAFHVLNDSPNWPLWVPLCDFSAQKRAAMEQVIGTIIADAAQPLYLVSAGEYNLRISCVRKL